LLAIVKKVTAFWKPEAVLSISNGIDSLQRIGYLDIG
jgi:hypothetical protein